MEGNIGFRNQLTLLCGKSAWKPVRTHGSMLFLDFGRLLRRPKDVLDHGEWGLIIEQADWFLFDGSQLIINSNSPTDKIDAILSSLELNIVLDASIDEVLAILLIEFSNSISLRVTQNTLPENQTEDQWIFYTPSDATWVFKAGRIYYEASNTAGA